MQALRRYLLLGTIASVVFVFYVVLSGNIAQDDWQSKNIIISSPLSARNQSYESVRVDHVPETVATIKPQPSKVKSPLSINIRPYLDLSQYQGTKLEQNLYNDKPRIQALNFTDSFDFASCRLSTCFNFTRCPPGDKLRVHIVRSKNSANYNQQSIEDAVDAESLENIQVYQKVLEVIRKSEYYESDPTKACLFVPESNTIDRDPLSPSFQQGLDQLLGPHNNYGLNYLLFNFYSGSWPNYEESDFAGMKIGAAILAKASVSYKHYRPGFDISLPLFSNYHPTFETNDSKHLEILGKKLPLLASFKGKRYIFGTGSDTRNSLFHLHNGRDIIILTTCKHGKKWQDVKDKRCDKDNANYGNYDYDQLMMNSTFCLVPRGRRLGSFRFLEALSYGCIPVVLSDNWVLPFSDHIDSSCFVINVDERLLLQLSDMLSSINLSDIELMQKNCLRFYRRYFSSVEKITLTVLSVIEGRIGAARVHGTN